MARKLKEYLIDDKDQASQMLMVWGDPTPRFWEIEKIPGILEVRVWSKGDNNCRVYFDPRYDLEELKQEILDLLERKDEQE
jgi:hypothetical protein